MDHLNPNLCVQTLDLVPDIPKRAATVDEAFGFSLPNVEDCGCRFYYTHNIDTKMDRLKLVATEKEYSNIKTLLNNDDVIKPCRRKQ